MSTLERIGYGALLGPALPLVETKPFDEARETTKVDEVAKGLKGASGYKTLQETKFKKGGSVSSASRRADGAAQRGKTKGRTL
jgi:hypothetical protein